MQWNGQELRTVADLCDAILTIVDSGSRDDTRRFMAAYADCNPDAAHDIGYISGYFNADVARKVRDWFQVTHPVFGDRDLTAEEAFAADRSWAEESRRPEERP